MSIPERAEIDAVGHIASDEYLRPTSYWMPEHIVTSAWLEHAPFAFWLVDALRPRSIVELGTHFGFSFFVFCEAVKRLDLETTVIGLDSWEGDDQAGYYGDEVYEGVEAVLRRDYPQIGRTVRGYFDDVRALVTGEFDILHVDGRHRYEDVSHDFNTWVDGVSPRGIVLFHDTRERAGDFGVWRFWEEISADHPSFEFEHGHGLGVLAVGSDLPVALTRFFAAAADDPSAVRTAYETLGAKVTRQARLEAMPAEVDSLHEVIGSLSAERIRLSAETADLTATVQEIHESTSWRITEPLRKLGSRRRRSGH